MKANGHLQAPAALLSTWIYQYPLVKRLDGSQCLYGHDEKEKIHAPKAGWAPVPVWT